jgi:6-phosphogluconolactonase
LRLNFEKRLPAAKILQEGSMMAGRAGRTRWLAWVILAGAVTALTGCDGFFVPVVPVPPGTTGNYAYVANSAKNSLSGFSLGTGTLKGVPNSPFSLGYSPQAIVVTRNNKFLYVAGPGTISVYTINSDGSLASVSGSGGVTLANVVSMDVTPDGKWLLALDATPLTAQIDEFQIDSTTGALAAAAPTAFPIPNVTIVPTMLRISPNGLLVFAALGTGGDLVYNFDTSNGALFNSQQLTVGNATSDNGLAVDSATTKLYIARSGTGGGVAVYNVGTAGALNPVRGSPFASGGQAFSVALDNTGKYAYAANRLDGTIYGYSVATGGGLAALGGSPYKSGSQVISLGMDSSGKYLLAAAFGGAPDLSMYSFDTATPGKLILASSAATGTSPSGAIAVALTH